MWLRGLTVVVLALAGCGRIAFDPVIGALDAPPGGPPGRIANPTATADEQFAHQLAISAAGNTIVVAARAADRAVQDSGVAYVFVPDASGWTLEATLVASVADAGDQLGLAVAISGDGNTIALGSTNEDGGGTGTTADPNDNSAPQSGAVLVFLRTGSTWSQQAYLKPPVTTAGELFGACVTLSANGNILAIGANKEGSVATDSGAAFMFTRTGGQWAFDTQLKATTPQGGEMLGTSCELSTDGTTFAVAIVGAAGTAGGAIVFHDEGPWVQQARLVPASAVAGDSVGDGFALSASGDTLAAGTGNHDVGAVDTGAVYMFERSGSTWSERDLLVAPNAQANDIFGYNVALAEDGDALVVGAEGADRGAMDTGSVYAFARSAGPWNPPGEVPVPAPVTGQVFGDSVAASADGSVFLVGAVGEDGRRGAVYVLRDLRAYAH